VDRADVAVVGAGAAGLIAAISAARAKPGAKILLLDSRAKIGAKILISGGTRCNVTNRQVIPSDYQGAPPHAVRHVLEAFSPEKTRRFFSEIGVELVLEPTGKYFPTTHSGRTVLDALVREVRRSGVMLETARVTGVFPRDGGFLLRGEGDFEFPTRRVILATGGLSLPETGSDGKGIEIARGLGHAIVPTFPALTPLLTDDEGWRSLSGITLEAALAFYAKGKKKASAKGSFLFTHFGFSGPSALDISRYWAAADPADEPSVEADFAPDVEIGQLGRRFEAFRKAGGARYLKTFFAEELGLPDRFAEVFLEKCGVDPRMPVRTLKEAGRLLHLLQHAPLEVNGVYGYKKAEATAGGVDLREVRVATMESKRVAGLHFAGEILDVDGRIGGFNFQWAWSSGWIAGRAAAAS